MSNGYSWNPQEPIAFNMVLPYVLLIIFVATLIQSTFGFGQAIVAVPLLAFFIPVAIATPLIVLLSITIGGIILLQDWRKIHLRSAGWLIGATVCGLPIGLLLLASSHPRALKALLALIILGFSLYALLASKRLVLHHDDTRLLFACGFVAGILGGAFAMNGPPLVLYGAMRQWTAQHFRATLQAYFLPASLIGLAGYWLAGLWVPAVTHDYFVSLPAAVPAVFLGRFLNHRIRSEGFVKYVYFGLFAISLLLLLEAIHGKL